MQTTRYEDLLANLDRHLIAEKNFNAFHRYHDSHSFNRFIKHGNTFEKIQMLNSPHWETLLKVYYIKHPEDAPHDYT